MSKFLDKDKAVAEIKDLVKNADQILVLISPYLKLSKDFKELLQFRNSKDKVTTIIFGKQELNPDEMKFLQGIQFVSLYYNEDLHAKCYVNDSKMIITSLNLYEFSMVNNKEMGILLERNVEADLEVFNEAWKEVEYIKSTSQRFEFGVQKPTVQKSFEKAQPQKVSSSRENVKNNGFCIRTGATIPFNPERPLSYDSYKSWNQFGDSNYSEKFCHFSGEPSNGETSVARPILYKNWKKAKELHGL